MTATNINTKAYTDMKQAHQKAFDDFAKVLKKGVPVDVSLLLARNSTTRARKK